MSTHQARKYPKPLPTPTQRRGAQTWEIRVRVPPEARGGKFKATHTTRSLKTRDKAEAYRKLCKVYDELQAEFETEAASLAGEPDQGDQQTPVAEDLATLSIDEVCWIDRQRALDSERCHRREVLSGPATQPARFLKGPVPWGWIVIASQLPGKALHVGLCLWRLHGIKKSKTVRLGTNETRALGISKYARARALKSLQTAELISVTQETGKLPVVTIVDT